MNTFITHLFLLLWGIASLIPLYVAIDMIRSTIKDNFWGKRWKIELRVMAFILILIGILSIAILISVSKTILELP